MQPTPIDLSNCDQEPIHIPGLIQPHGALIVLRRHDLTICQVSSNTTNILGLAPARLLQQPVEALLPEKEQVNYRQSLLNDVTESKPLYLFSVRTREIDDVFDAIAHRSGNCILLELEPSSTERDLTAPDLYRLVQTSVAKLQQAASVARLCHVCAEQVRRVSGFDRVMVYRFDEEWNGEIVAEDKREDLEPFLGLHYPASDIPKQARELYTKNWLRFIANRDYVPTPIIPANNPDTGEPLDLSFSVLRSVSPIHLEYLKNMGVGASMSVSLMKDGKLWGLIACHHYSPRHVPYDVRTACELLGQMMSPHLSSAEERQLVIYREKLRDVREGMLANLERLEDEAKALVGAHPNLLSFIEAGGAAVVMDDEVARVGHTPGDEDILRLSDWILEHAQDDVFATDRLQDVFGSGVLASVASGVLAVSLTARRRHQLLWFRPEQVRTVHWAGDPAKSVVKGEGEARLSPRGSFSLWKETVKGRSKPWTEAEISAAGLLRQDVMGLLIRRARELVASNKDLRFASAERDKLLESERSARSEIERVSRMKDDFVATLSHELRTPLNAILGWAQILTRSRDLSPDVIEGLSVIERNARSQAQMIDDLLEMSRIISGKLRLDLQDTDLPKIVHAAIETVQLAADSRDIRIEKLIDPLPGIGTTGDPNRLQQVVWNLLSNAVKFTPKGGKIQVVLERVDSHVELSVSDTGMGIKPEFLPHVFDRFRQADASAGRVHGGLGLGLSIVRNLVELHGGTVRAASLGEGQGSTFVVSLPVRVVSIDPRTPHLHPKAQAMPLDCEMLNLKGVRVLVVDDEPDARHLVKRVLEECECLVSAVGSGEEALQLSRTSGIDVLISDIGMPNEDGYAFIRRWREQEATSGLPKTPAVALTAYARAEDRRRAILAGYQAHIAKPVETGELLAVVASLAGRV
jgi:light-regulated signal transduction histidine kinase (bacteriophytochrome)/CheY-like chemotaxis protein